MRLRHVSATFQRSSWLSPTGTELWAQRKVQGSPCPSSQHVGPPLPLRSSHLSLPTFASFKARG